MFIFGLIIAKPSMNSFIQCYRWSFGQQVFFIQF